MNASCLVGHLFSYPTSASGINVKVARWGFSGPIPSKFRYKLRSPLTNSWKTYHRAALDKDENLFWSRLQWHRSCYSKEMTPFSFLLAAVFTGTGNSSPKNVLGSFFLLTYFLSEILCLHMSASHFSEVLSPRLVFTWTAVTWRNVSYCCPRRYDTWSQYLWIMRGISASWLWRISRGIVANQKRRKLLNDK